MAIAPAEEDYESKLREAIPKLHLHSLKHLSPKGKNPLQDIQLLLELRKIYQKYKPSKVLHFTIKANIYGGLAARLSHVPFIATLTGLGFTFIRQGMMQNIVVRLYRLALKKAEFVVFQNQDDALLFQQKKIISPQQSQLIPGSGVDSHYFSLAPLPSPVPFRFLFVGRLLFDKGIREFVEAAQIVSKSLDQVEFWVAGSISDKNPASISEEQVQKWKDLPKFKWLGQVEDIRSVIFQSHMLVLPSYREGMPRAILEAMAMGRPIITTDTPGCRDTVEAGKNGWLVAVKNSEELSQAMLNAQNLPLSKLERMGRNSRKKVEDTFEVNLINKSYLNLIKRESANT